MRRLTLIAVSASLFAACTINVTYATAPSPMPASSPAPTPTPTAEPSPMFAPDDLASTLPREVAGITITVMSDEPDAERLEAYREPLLTVGREPGDVGRAFAGSPEDRIYVSAERVDGVPAIKWFEARGWASPGRQPMSGPLDADVGDFRWLFESLGGKEVFAAESDAGAFKVVYFKGEVLYWALATREEPGAARDVVSEILAELP